MAAVVSMLLFLSNLHAADTIRVEPGVGTIQTAINHNGGDMIYLLQAGAVYYLDGIVNVFPRVLGGSDKTLTIVGEEIASPADSCREYGILHDKVSWPNMKYNHNWYDQDPLYNDTMIYCINDSVGEHILGFYRKVFWEEADAPEVSDLPSYNWDIDGYNGYDPADPPATWPRFDGSYTNPVLLIASQEGMPLGDLNWYPDLKQKWDAYRELIQAHVLELNEERIKLPDRVAIQPPQLDRLEVRCYPNPVGDFMNFVGEDLSGATVQIINMTGSVVLEELLESDSSALEMGGLTEGLYEVRIVKLDRQYTGAISKL
ncbi:MAG: T9SS type A sorting domain-containing protein [Bacteroidota bacterium]